MICNLTVRRTTIGEDDIYTLRVTGKTALGPSGTGGRDGKDFTSQTDLLTAIQNLGVPEDAVRVAEAAVTDPARDGKFTDIAGEVQIPFQVLEGADFYLFD